jgi:hypothetical protein
MKDWLINLFGRYLTDQGYWVIKSTMPCLLVSYATGTMQSHEDGSTTYMLRLPPGHKLWALNHTLIMKAPT